MKKLILLLPLILVSCAPPTDADIAEQKRICDINWQKVIINLASNEVDCEYKPPKTSVMDCIREYTNGLDKKYNNPDIVSNLKEDDYSKVVRTCNEIFWKTLSWSVDQ